MRSNYNRIGDYIQEINNINTNLSVNYLRGISSIYKEFITSKANIIGVDFLDYKIVKNGQFAYNPNTARMGDKIPIALNNGEDCIVSKIYPVFEIFDKNKLDPEYLMMWFRRPEFDRYARFKSHGSAREIFDWEEMCETELPVPHIDKQGEIVKEYNVLVDRINLNNQLIQKLEETAQTIYKQWFVDFEFPDENGKPYKLNGGKMEFNEDLEKDIPKGWEVGELKDIAVIIMGQSPEGKSYNNEKKGMIFYQGRTDFGFRFPDITTYTTEPKKKAQKNDILISVRAPVGDLNITAQDCSIGRGVGALRSKLKCNSHLFYLLKELKTKFDVTDGEGTIFGSINKDVLYKMKVIYSQNSIFNFDKIVNPIDNQIKLYCNQSRIFNSLKDLLLSKLATINN